LATGFGHAGGRDAVEQLQKCFGRSHAGEFWVKVKQEQFSCLIFIKY
jgi:hypothetical protein